MTLTSLTLRKRPASERVVDAGRGTGAGDSVCKSRPSTTGVDVDGWAASEGEWIYTQLGLPAELRVAALGLTRRG